MKNITAILLLLMWGCIYFSCAKEETTAEEPEITSEESELIDINGEWLGQGYACETIKYTEKISISHDLKDGKVTATKITGDPCVPAGYVTFFGNYDGKTSSFEVTWYGGSPHNPASATDEGSVDIINSELMHVNLHDIHIFTKID